MAYDFRANQIRTNKIIASGSSGFAPKLLIYPVNVASDYQGNVAASFATSSVGRDVFFYVSGAIGGKNQSTNAISLFGGDVAISGSVTVETGASIYGTLYSYNAFSALGTSTFLGNASFTGTISASNTASFTNKLIVSGTFDSVNSASFYHTASFKSRVEVSGTMIVSGQLSGSLQKLADGTSYLVEGSNVTITSQSNGSIVIAASGGSSLPTGSINGVYYYSSSGPALTNSGSARVPFVASVSPLAPKFSQYLSPIYVGTGNDSNIDSNTAILLGQTVGRIKQEVALNTYSDVYKFSSAYHVFGGSDPGAYLNGTKIVYKSGGEFNIEHGEGSNIFPIQINNNNLTLRGTGGAVTIGNATNYVNFSGVPVATPDNSTTSTVNILTLYHKIFSLTPGNGIGARLTFAIDNSSLIKTDAFYIDSTFVTASAGNQINKTTFYSVSRSFMGPSAPESKVLEFTNDEFVFGKQPVVHFNGPMRTENYDITGSTYTLNPLLDSGSIRFTHTGSRTINLPAANSIQNKFFGCEWRIHDAARTADSGSITITASSGVTLNGTITGSVVLFTKGSAILLRLISSNTWETIGI